MVFGEYVPLYCRTSDARPYMLFIGFFRFFSIFRTGLIVLALDEPQGGVAGDEGACDDEQDDENEKNRLLGDGLPEFPCAVQEVQA